MIEINNLTNISADNNFLKRLAKIVLIGENRKEENLSIVLVGPLKIRQLNKKYRGENKTTDVLSFGMADGFKMPEKEIGEIAICLSQVKKNAREYKSTFKKELSMVLIHGVLHLLGYEHEKSDKQANKMKERQDYYLSQI